jgi:tetratricopeptide (TPR) repeat protein
VALGDAALLRGDRDSAIDYYSLAIREGTDQALAYRRRGEAYATDREDDKAASDLGSAISLKPDDPDLYAIRGRIMAAKGSIDLALADYSKALSLSPTRAEIYFARGRLFFARTQYEMAISDYSEAIARKTDFLDAISARAYLELLTKDYAKALADLDRAIELKPEMPDFYFLRGSAEDALGDTDKAIEDFRVTTRLAPHSWQGFQGLGRLLELKGNHLQAIRQLSIAVTLNPVSANSLYERGVAYLGLNDFESAKVDFDTVISQNRGFTDAYVGRAKCELAIGDTESALNDLGLALSGESDSVTALSIRSLIYGRRARYDLALADLKAADNSSHSNAETANALAWMLAACPDAAYRDGPKSVTLANKALYLSNQKVPKYLETLAAAEASAGDYEEAARAEAKFIAAATSPGESVESNRRLRLYQDRKPFVQ